MTDKLPILSGKEVIKAPGKLGYSVTDQKGSHIHLIVEKHPDGYIAYPPGMKGVVIGEGNTCEEALNDVKSAIQFHIESFGDDAYEHNDIIGTFMAGVTVSEKGNTKMFPRSRPGNRQTRSSR